MNIRDLCGDIGKKDIFLFGVEPEIENFIKKYNNIIHIKGVITDHNDEMKLQSFKEYGIETLWLEEQKLGGNSFIIICGGLIFNSRRMRLLYLGLTEYKDFISCNLIETLISNKKTIVMMGTPILNQVSKAFMSEAYLENVFNVVYISDSIIREPYADASGELSHIARFCDFYINVACEKERYLFKNVGEKILNNTCMQIRVSDCGFRGFYPQYSCDREIFSDYFLRGGVRLEMNYNTLVFSKQDMFLTKLCLTESTENIIDMVMSPGFISESVVENIYNSELERMKKYDSKSDIKLLDYYLKTPHIVNRSMEELNEDGVRFVCNSMLDKMKVSYQIENVIADETWGTEAEIYPSVQKYFGDDSLLKNKKYKIVSFNKTQYMSLEEYFRYHIEYLKEAIELKKLTHMNKENN